MSFGRIPTDDDGPDGTGRYGHVEAGDYLYSPATNPDLQRGYIGRDLKESGAPAALLFSALRAANLARLKHFPGHDGTDVRGEPQPDEPTRILGGWTYTDWMTALVGEVGELANLLKKRRRGWVPAHKKGWDPDEAAEELADIQTYLDLLAACLGVDLAAVTVAKFNKVSERAGLPDRL